MLVDIVSKNGNLLLNIPLKGDGTMDPTEYRIVQEIGHWMKINSESIYDTRPWVIYGEGPVAEAANPLSAQGFNEGKVEMSSKDIRFNKKGDKVLYVTVCGKPEEDIVVKSLGTQTAQNRKRIRSISMLGSNELVQWNQEKERLTINKPQEIPSPEAVVYCVTFR